MCDRHRFRVAVVAGGQEAQGGVRHRFRTLCTSLSDSDIISREAEGIIQIMRLILWGGNSVRSAESAHESREERRVYEFLDSGDLRRTVFLGESDDEDVFAFAVAECQ